MFNLEPLYKNPNCIRFNLINCTHDFKTFLFSMFIFKRILIFLKQIEGKVKNFIRFAKNIIGL